MIKHVRYPETKLLTFFHNTAQRLIKRNYQHAKAFRQYKNHGTFFVLLYCCLLTHMPKIIFAENQAKVNGIDVETKKMNEMSALVNAAKIDDFDDEYFDNGIDDYRELISNKSSKYLVLLRYCRCLLLLSGISMNNCHWFR